MLRFSGVNLAFATSLQNVWIGGNRMHHIYYFNINYYCNNKCIYCFSPSTERKKGYIEFHKIVDIFKTVELNSDDKIIINGGEPTLHPEFYAILEHATLFHSDVVVYSNAVKIDLSSLPPQKNIHFVIPIHGEESTHNMITRNKVSFLSTINNIRALQEDGRNVEIKFILNKNLLSSGFNIIDFLYRYRLNPMTIVLARLNKTRISEKNNVEIPDYRDLRQYFYYHPISALSEFAVKTIDLPPCCIGIDSQKIHIPVPPLFYFTDYQYVLKKCLYHKKVKINDNCVNCPHVHLCDALEKSYHTLCWQGEGWKMKAE